MVVSVVERNDEVARLREEGLAYREIGRRLGVSGERVRQILRRNTGSEIPHLPPKAMLTVSEAAHLLGIHTNTLRRWSEKGVLRSYRISARGDRRYRRKDLDNFLKRRQH